MLQKWPYFDQNHGLTLLETSQFFEFLNFLFFYCPRRRFFVLDYRKSHFPYQYCLKKNDGKMAIFGPKPWVNPLGKMSIFRHSELLVFIAKKGAFSFQIIVKVIFLTNIPLQKRLEKWPYLDQNHGLTPLEKLQFFDILNFLFLQPRKAFFSSRIQYKSFS